MQSKYKFLGLLVDDKTEQKPENTGRFWHLQPAHLKICHFLGDKWNSIKTRIKNGLKF